LLRRLAADRPLFDTLVAMSDQDSTVIRIAPDFTWLAKNWVWPRPASQLGFSQARWNRYRELFRRLGLQHGLERERLVDSSPAVFLWAFGLGAMDHGSRKGYLFTRGSVAPLLPSLDRNVSAAAGGAEHGTAYRAVGAGWYLEFDW
jgi:hypothetical protein